ncbi:hypothetical protein WA026_002864 [Henosepilachna vigintioctopunctata]|uniref:Uncharacterized protein n=1 Tax=Henosepilachna vigintioctopunctata TaxID=420089 RepID=A0AAW1TLT2_9CUCU
MERSLREVLDRLSLFSALNPYNYFLLGYITTVVITRQAENLRLLRKSIIEECWDLTLAILDKIRRYLVDKLNICHEHLIVYFEGLLLSMFITSSEEYNIIFIVFSSSDDSEHLDDSTSTGQNCSPKEEFIIKMPEHQDHEGTAQEFLLELKIECSKDMESSLRGGSGPTITVFSSEPVQLFSIGIYHYGGNHKAG